MENQISALLPRSRGRCLARCVLGGQRPPPARPATLWWPLPRWAPSFVWSTTVPPDGVAWPAASSSQSLILPGPSRAVGRTPGNWTSCLLALPDCPLVPSPQAQAAQGRLGLRCTWGRCMPSGSRHNHQGEVRVRDWAGRRQAPCSPEAGRHRSPPPWPPLPSCAGALWVVREGAGGQ